MHNYLNFIRDGVNVDINGKSLDKSNPLIATPSNICDDMIQLFPNIEFTNNHIFLEMYCKTGNFITSLKKQGVDSDNIIAICDNLQSQMLTCKVLYGELKEEINCNSSINHITRRGQVYYIRDYKSIVKDNKQKHIGDILKTIKEQYQMQFGSADNFEINNIVMNPPYNNDIYIYIVYHTGTQNCKRQCSSNYTSQVAG